MAVKYPLLQGESGAPIVIPNGMVLVSNGDGSFSQGAGGGGGVSSVFTRTGAVVAANGDYAASQVTNDSGVFGGGTVSSALVAIQAAIAAVTGAVSSVFGRTGAVVAANGDYNSTQVTNSSGVTGATVTSALNALAASIALGVTIGTTAPLAGGGSGTNFTLSVAALSNTTSGVVASVGATGTVLKSTGTAGAWGALDPTVLASFAASPAANSFLKGNGAGVAASWAALQTSPANPGDNGKLFVALNGDASFSAGSVAGAVPTWDTVAVAFDFTGTKSIVTTAQLQSNNAAPVLRLGLASGSGAGAAAATGAIRGARDFAINAVAGDNVTDVALFTWTAATPDLSVGSSAVVLNLRTGATGMNIFVNGTNTVSFASTQVNMLSVGTYQWANGLTALLRYQASSAATTNFQILGQDCSASTTALAGDVRIIAGNGTAAGAISVSQTAGTSFLQGGVSSGSSGTRVQGKAQLRDPNGVAGISITNASVGAATKMAFFNATEVVQPTRVGQLTDSTTGTPSNTLVDVGVAFSQANVNNNFSSVLTKINAIETRLSAAGGGLGLTA